jgi:hypothetical protein
VRLGLNQSVSRQGPLVNFSERGGEHSGFIKIKEFIVWPNEY